MTTTTAAPEPTERPADRTEREAMIRDLYSLAAFYVANPDHPLPTSIHMYHQEQSLETVRAVADKWSNRDVYGTAPQADHMLPDTSIPVTLLVAAKYAGFDA